MFFTLKRDKTDKWQVNKIEKTNKIWENCDKQNKTPNLKSGFLIKVPFYEEI